MAKYFHPRGPRHPGRGRIGHRHGHGREWWLRRRGFFWAADHREWGRTTAVRSTDWRRRRVIDADQRWRLRRSRSGHGYRSAGTSAAMTCTGDLAFQCGAFYFARVKPTTASTTNVFNTVPVSLAGTVVANFAPGSYVSRSYTILTALPTGGGITVTFDAPRT